VSVLIDPLLSKDAENLAREIAGVEADAPKMLECARRLPKRKLICGACARHDSGYLNAI
jgi:hypothetical protein